MAAVTRGAARTVGPAQSDGPAVRLPITSRSRAGLRPVRLRLVLGGALLLLYVLLCVAVVSGSPLVDLDTAVLRWSP